MQTGRPDAAEHHPYYRPYVDLVPEDDVVDVLRRGIVETTALLRGLPDDRGDFAYAPGKWTVKDVLAHVMDFERTTAFRAFWFARGGPGELASFDQDRFVAESGAGGRSLESLLDEFEAVRAGSVTLYASLGPDVALRTGTASGYEVSVRALAFISAGHERHHREHLRTTYGLGR